MFMSPAASDIKLDKSRTAFVLFIESTLTFPSEDILTKPNRIELTTGLKGPKNRETREKFVILVRKCLESLPGSSVFLLLLYHSLLCFVFAREKFERELFFLGAQAPPTCMLGFAS